MARRKLSPGFDLMNIEGEVVQLLPTAGDFALKISAWGGNGLEVTTLSIALNVRQVRQLARLLLEAAEARDGGGDA